MNSTQKQIIFIPGAQKAGTTSMHELISRHEHISCPRIKETHFFSNENNFNKGLDWYLKQFDISKQILCEVDPSYLFYPSCPKRIKSKVENPKFIIIFRRPIERALSHYLMSFYKGYEDLSFLDALKAESERLKVIDNDFSMIHHSYIMRGNYSFQLNRYLSIFDKRDFLFIKFDDLISKDNNKTIDGIFNFIKLDNSSLDTEVSHSNRRKKIKYKLIRDLLYKDNIFRTAMQKVVTSDLLRIKLKEIINYLNSDKHEKDNSLSSDILDLLPNNYLKWNNKEVKSLKKITSLDIDDWIYS